MYIHTQHIHIFKTENYIDNNNNTKIITHRTKISIPAAIQHANISILPLVKKPLHSTEGCGGRESRHIIMKWIIFALASPLCICVE